MALKRFNPGAFLYRHNIYYYVAYLYYKPVNYVYENELVYASMAVGAHKTLFYIPISIVQHDVNKSTTLCRYTYE